MNVFAPDWSRWQAVREVTVGEAVLLSIGVDPDKLRKAQEISKDRGHRFVSLYQEEIDDRVLLAGRGGNGLGLVQQDHVEPSRSVVNLRAFGAWATAQGWDLPPEFPIPPAAGESKTKIVSRREPEQARQERVILEWLASEGIDPLQMPKPPLGNKPWPLRERMREELNLSKDVVKKAMQRLRTDKRLKNA